MNVNQINLSGSSRCFVVGDVAGHFSQLGQLINRMDLNPRTDKLVLNGNFLGLAPSSRQALSWLEKDWIIAIMGVNEARILDRLKGLEVPTLAGQWISFLSAQDRTRLLAHLEALPIALETRYQENHIVVSHAPLSSTTRWSELQGKLLQWTGSAHKVFELFESRLLGLTALGHLIHAGALQHPDDPMSLSSISLEKPVQPVVRKGRYVFLVGSAHMNHGNQYAHSCLMPFVELTTLTKHSTEETIWKGSLDTLAR